MRRLFFSLATVALLIAGLAPASAAAASPPEPVNQEVPVKDGNLHKPLYRNADSVISNVIETADTMGAVAGLNAAKTSTLRVSGGKIHVIVEASNVGAAIASAKSAGATVGRNNANLIQVDATPAQLKALLEAPGVSRIRQPAFHAEQAVPTIQGQEVAGSNAISMQMNGTTGAGVKIAIIDGGFANLAAAQTAGEVPMSATEVDYCAGEFDTATDHGTAVAEVVHEMAPDAQLYLICIGDEIDLADAEDYAKTNGVDIVNHSMGWYNAWRGDGSGPDGTPDFTANDAVTNGILWVNSAGNDAQHHWSGNFVDSGVNLNIGGGETERLHRFASGDTSQSFSWPLNSVICAFLKWDAWPTTYNDYDMWLVSPGGSLYYGSANYQEGDPPTEGFCYQNTIQAGTWGLEIGRYYATSAPRFDLFLLGVEPQYKTLAGSITDPAAAPDVFAVGAQCWNATTIESFSSRGPNIAGVVKPDITAQDQMSGLTYGLDVTCANLADGFAGTSSSSPTVAGAAALVLEANPTFTVADLKNYLMTNSKDEGTAGKDSTYGSGLLWLPSGPWPPTSPVATAYNQSAGVTWGASVNDGAGGTAITGYNAYVVGDHTKTCSTTGALTCTVLGLTNGTPYQFEVTATSAHGTSSAAGPSNVVTPLAVPDAPPVTAVGFADRVDVTWTAPADNGNAIDDYHVTLEPGGLTFDAGNATTFSHSFPGLSNHVTFTATVTAHNSQGYGAPGTAQTQTRTGNSYVPLTPNRVLDSKTSLGFVGPLPVATGTSFQVTGLHAGDASLNVPAEATSVTGILSVQDATYKGWVAVTPEPDNAPTTSSINFPANDKRSTGITVPLGTGGKLSVTYGAPAGNTVQVIFEITGYFVEGTSGSTYKILTPTRILDSRPTGSGHTNVGLTGKFTAGTPRAFQVTGSLGAPLNKVVVPAEAIAVTGTLTVTSQTAAGFLTIGPDELASPDTASLFFPVGDNRATGLTVKLGVGGTLAITYTSTTVGATTDAIFDVNGYFVPGFSGAMYIPVTPNRIVDSRVANGLSTHIHSHVAGTFQVTGRNPADPTKNVPAGAVAMTGTLTVTGQTNIGWLALTPTPNNNPPTSSLNFPKGDNRATGVTVPLSTAGKCSVTYGANVTGTAPYTHVVFDVSGYFVN